MVLDGREKIKGEKERVSVVGGGKIDVTNHLTTTFENALVCEANNVALITQ